MPNRLTRDELIMSALQMVQLANLEVHDMPDGVVQPNAFCIEWLQDILDFWYHMRPFSATVNEVPITITANTNTVTLPSDFILDMRNGMLVQSIPGDPLSLKRMYRVPLQKFVNRRVATQKQITNVLYPIFYCVYGDDNNILTQNQVMHIAPIPTINVTGSLLYYKLPPPLQSNERPKFPNDFICKEYLRIRALEWAHMYDPGTAQKFCDKVVAGMQAQGLLNEPEDDEIPFDVLNYTKLDYASVYFTTYAWMGPQ